MLTKKFETNRTHALRSGLLNGLLASTSALIAVAPAHAQTPPALMERLQKSNCIACHSIDKKVVGPALREVATKYRGDSAAEAKLVTKIKAGGSGVWGPMVMPPQNLKDDEAHAVVKLILQIK